MDPVERVADVGVAVRRDWVHAAHVLEEEELSDEFALLGRVHGARGVFNQCDYEFLRVADRVGGVDLDAGHLCRFDAVCVPDEI